MGMNWMERMDLSDQPPLFQPLIEIASDQRVLIEHHLGISLYGTDQICVKVKFGSICVEGKGLLLTRMTKEQLIITGQIACVRLERR